MNLILKENQKYGSIPIDFFEDIDKNIYVSSEQLAKGFGYKSRKGIEKLIERNKYLRNRNFSVMVKVPYGLGGTQETRVFNKRGIFEIGVLSRTKQGQAFREWIYNYIEKLENEVIAFRIQRELEKPRRKQLTEAVENWQYFNKWSYKQMTDLLLKKVTGKNAKQLKNGLNVSALELLTASQLETYRELENKVIVMIEINMTYDEIKEKIKEI